MADRISRAELDGVARVINTRTGSPQEPHSWDENGKYAGQAGCYYIDKSNGAYALYRVCKDGHGSHNVFNARIGARDLWNRMRAFIDGLEAAEQNADAMERARRATLSGIPLADMTTKQLCRYISATVAVQRRNTDSGENLELVSALRDAYHVLTGE